MSCVVVVCLHMVHSVVEQFVALYSYASNETGDLTFNQGDVITVSQQEGDWWTGSIGALSGIFPANYVQKMKSAVGTSLLSLTRFN